MAWVSDLMFSKILADLYLLCSCAHLHSLLSPCALYKLSDCPHSHPGFNMLEIHSTGLRYSCHHLSAEQSATYFDTVLLGAQHLSHGKCCHCMYSIIDSRILYVSVRSPIILPNSLGYGVFILIFSFRSNSPWQGSIW